MRSTTSNYERVPNLQGLGSRVGVVGSTELSASIGVVDQAVAGGEQVVEPLLDAGQNGQIEDAIDAPHEQHADGTELAVIVY